MVWKGEDMYVPSDSPLDMVLSELCLEHPNNVANRHHAKDSKSICFLWLAVDATSCFIPSITSCIAVLKAAILRLCEDSICFSKPFCDSMHFFCNRVIQAMLTKFVTSLEHDFANSRSFSQLTVMNWKCYTVRNTMAETFLSSQLALGQYQFIYSSKRHSISVNKYNFYVKLYYQEKI